VEVVIAYTRMGFQPNENPLMNHCADREIFQGKVSLETFTSGDGRISQRRRSRTSSSFSSVSIPGQRDTRRGRVLLKREYRDHTDDIQRSIELALSFAADMSLADVREDAKTQQALTVMTGPCHAPSSDSEEICDARRR
jgi:hypothetical protein